MTARQSQPNIAEGPCPVRQGDLDPAAAHTAAERDDRTDDLIDQVRRLLEQERVSDALQLLDALHPADQGDVLVDLPSDSRQEILDELPPEGTAGIFEHLTQDEAAQVSEQLDTAHLAGVLDETDPDVAADVLQNIPDHRLNPTLEEMVESDAVAPLLEYPDESAGGVMDPEPPYVMAGTTAANALDILRLRAQAESPPTMPVIDRGRILVGRVDVVNLALARPSIKVSDIMDPHVVSVTPETDQEECAALARQYDFDLIPVVDSERRLLGAIHAADILDVVVEEATEDMYRIAAVEGESVQRPLLRSMGRRMPWLGLNLVTVFLAALVIGVFESTVARVVTLAIFLPIIPGQAGMSGMQTLTLVVRSMALGELPGRRVLRLLVRELALALAQGVLLGAVVGAAAYAWKGDPTLGIILAAAMVGNMIIAGLTGAGVPLILRKLKMDPAVSAAVFITTFTDVLGLLLFLGLATLLIDHLL